MAPKTICIAQDGPANALALNKDCTQVVIAGRNIFKVFSVDDEEFIETCNLRVGKNLNLNFSCNDVAWNTLDEHILATAATNGAVVIWNLNRPGRSKQEHVFGDHKRTVNKVSFNPHDAHCLLSCSQDGTMKCFDLRIKEAQHTYFSNTESVRDVKVNPHASHTFAAVSENGNCQIWDFRAHHKMIYQFTAHSGPIFSCDWHSDLPWLATASRDKHIKVWEITSKPYNCAYVVSSISPVGQVKWRPHRKFHLASCALVLDNTINIWDIQRPYIPFATFEDHKDITTGIAWRADPRILLSTSRDCMLYQHVIRDSVRPANSVNPQSVTFNTTGEVAYAYRLNITLPVGSKTTTTNTFSKKTPQNEQFYQTQSSLYRFTHKVSRESKQIVECAKRYVLTGRSLADICDHNAVVARDLGKTHVSIVWSIIKTLYSTKMGDFCQQNTANVIRDDQREPSDGDQRSLLGTGGDTPGGHMSAGEDDVETDETPDHNFNERLGFGALSSGFPTPRGDFFFGDAEVDPLGMDFEYMSNGEDLVLSNGLLGISETAFEADHGDWTLQTEAFPLRHEIQDRSPPPEEFPNHRSPELNENDHTISVEDQPFSLICVTLLPRLALWDPSTLVADMLKYHANRGDIQTCVSVMLVLGRRNLPMIDETTVEHWLLGYIDVLARHQLYTVVTQVIKLAWIPTVCQLNQQSTLVHTACGRCNKQLGRSGWLCDRCRVPDAAACSVCHKIVRGLYSWCQGCSHGGHLSHMKQWWDEGNKQCPTGCGHICEYS